MKTSKSLQLLDAQNNNISPAVGVESIFFEKTENNITNRYPLSFVSVVNNSSVGSGSISDNKKVSFVGLSKEVADASVYALDVSTYSLGEIKSWMTGVLNTSVNNIQSTVSNNEKGITNLKNRASNIDASLNNTVVRKYFNTDSGSGSSGVNSPNQRTGFRLASPAVETVLHNNDKKYNSAAGILNHFPSVSMYDDVANTDWFNATINSSYLSLHLGFNASTSSNTTQLNTGINYYYASANVADGAHNASMFFDFNDVGDTDTYMFKAPTIQLSGNERFPYLPGYHPKWLANGSTYILALAADNPSLSTVNNDSNVHLAWLNSNAINDTENTKKLIQTLWNSSIAVGSTTVKNYVDTSINTAYSTLRSEINSSINAAVGNLNGYNTVVDYVNASINAAYFNYKVWKDSDTTNLYYLMATDVHTTNGIVKNNIYVPESKLWYFQSGNLYGGNIYSTSDERLKHDITVVDNEKIDYAIKPKSFKWNQTNEQSYGFIAQEVEQDYPELVETDTDGFKKVNYNAALSLLVGKLINKIEKLEERIAELEHSK